MSGKDILGDFFESITRDGFKQNKGQFFTPTPIVNFILYAMQLDNLALNKINEERELPFIIDPSAGSGSYLVEAMKLITKEVKYKQRAKIKKNRQTKRRFEELFTPDYNENKWARDYLYGLEINFDLGTSSKVNMILHGDGSTNIFVKDGLLPFRFYFKETSPNFLETAITDNLYQEKEINGKFDVVISNPPFSVNLDTQTQKEIKNSFLFGDKKNSENLFIERYYQLLKEGGRLGVVLPESVFDTTENRYIRLFLFKYFNIKAIVSLPPITFEPYTSTKTSLLFAQKKTKTEVETWNKTWEKHGRIWSSLKTRINDYVKYFVKGTKLNKQWVKDVVKDIEDGNTKNILSNIHFFLKDYILDKDKTLGIKEVLEKYIDNIDSLSKYDKKESEVFGFYNAWWVFGEVTKEIDYDIFMAEVENVGYKRTKVSEKEMPNDLYDVEYAPQTLDTSTILGDFVSKIDEQRDKKTTLQQKKQKLAEKDKDKPTATTSRRIVKLQEEIDQIDLIIQELNDELSSVQEVLQTYYKDDELMDEYHDRLNEELIFHFKQGLLRQYNSNDILLRKDESIKILDFMRKDISWH